MNKTLLFALLIALPALSAPVASAGETKFRGVAPRSEHVRHYGHQTQRHNGHQTQRRYDRYRTSRHYRAGRDYSRYRNRPHADYVYRPLPSRYSNYRNYNQYRYQPYYRNYYRHRGDGIRLGPDGLTIFLDLGD